MTLGVRRIAFPAGLLAGVLLLAGGRAAADEEVVLAYDDGSIAGWMPMEAGDVESVWFTCLHPCKLLGFSFMVVGRLGPMEWHVWEHNGGLNALLERDLVESFVVTPSSARTWIDVDLSDRGLEFDALKHFHIGYVKLADQPRLAGDGSPPTDTSWETTARSSVFDRSRGEWFVSDGDFLLRARVLYHNMVTEDQYLFSDVSDTAGVGYGRRRPRLGRLRPRRRR